MNSTYWLNSNTTSFHWTVTTNEMNITLPMRVCVCAYAVECFTMSVICTSHLVCEDSDWRLREATCCSTFWKKEPLRSAFEWASTCNALSSPSLSLDSSSPESFLWANAFRFFLNSELHNAKLIQYWQVRTQLHFQIHNCNKAVV